MLVLTRGLGEGIVINTSDGIVRLVFLDNPGHDSARVGISAPKNCEILRDELVFDRAEKEITGNNGNRR